MSPDQESQSKGWWQTLPGLLTAGAAIITAIGGLLAAVHQTGWFAGREQPPARIQSESTSGGAGPRPAGSTADGAPSGPGVTKSKALALPEMAEINSGNANYKLLSARVDSHSPDTVSLHLVIRMTNNNRFAANFWAASFRLAVNGALQAPENDLDETVSAHSSREGNVEFVIPANVTTVGLQMGVVGDGKPTLELHL